MISEEDSATIPVTDQSSASTNSGVTGNSDAAKSAETETPLTDPKVCADISVDDSDDLYTPEDAAADFGDNRMPDPSFLLSMVTMQMEPSQLMRQLIPIFDGYAWRAMGFLADPATGETKKDIPLAQLSIDTVQFFMSKVDSQLSETERRDLQRRLSDLRMNFISKRNEA